MSKYSNFKNDLKIILVIKIDKWFTEVKLID
jgi:hypothetical protein